MAFDAVHSSKANRVTFLSLKVFNSEQEPLKLLVDPLSNLKIQWAYRIPLLNLKNTYTPGELSWGHRETQTRKPHSPVTQ